MKTIILALATSLICSTALFAQTQSQPISEKFRIYGEIGLGFGQTLFFGDTQQQLRAAYGGSFEAGTGNNIMMGFYVAPESWRGLGVGSRIKGTFGASVKGDFGNDYIFNYYNLALTAKYYPISQEFNNGLYARASIGFGQLTTKRVDEARNFYKHQYALGSTLMGGIGYTFPIGRYALSIEGEFEYSSRSGTIDGQKELSTFKSGQLGGNIILSF